MSYVDGFVLPLPRKSLDQYQEIARKASVIWKEHGALDYREWVGDDFDAGEMISFPRMAQSSDDETVVLAWIVFESREHRDAVNAKVMADPRMQEFCAETTAVFDYKRMAYGGFKSLVP